MNWFAQYAQLCGDMSPLGKVVLLGDLSIALAYFALPVGLLIVWRNRLNDLPYPWMLCLFAAFIVGCGLTHLVHALQMPYTTFAHTTLEAVVKSITALLSIGTAAALLALLPRIFRIVSPKARQEELARLVAERTRENNALIREINHQLGNQLQIMSSAIRIERRKVREECTRASLGRLEEVLSDLVTRYRKGHLAEDTIAEKTLASEAAPLSTATH